MPYHKFDIRRNGEPLFTCSGVCAAGVIGRLAQMLRNGEAFMLVISGTPLPVDDEGLRAYLLPDDKLPDSVHYAYDDSNIYIDVAAGAGIQVITTICFIWQVLRQPWERPLVWGSAVEQWLSALDSDEINRRGDDAWMHALAWECFLRHVPANQNHSFRTVHFFSRGHAPRTVANIVTNKKVYVADFYDNGLPHFNSWEIFRGVNTRANRTITAVRRALQ